MVTVLLDTALLPPAERTDAAYAAYEGQSPLRTVRFDPGPVRHRIERLGLGPDVHLLRSSGDPVQILRTAAQVRADAVEHIAIGLHRRGRTGVVTTGSETDIPVGHLNGVDMTRAYRLRHHTAHDHDVLILSNDAVDVSVDVVRAAVPALVRSPVYDLVRVHIAGLHRAAAALPPTQRTTLRHPTAALVRALLTTAAQSAAGRGAMHEALEVRIALYIDAHLGDRALTAARIAAAHDISLRHLYNLWSRAGHDDTPAQWIIRRRLERARDLLSSTGSRPVSIAKVAEQTGFADASHFGRRFRGAYGVAPREWRRRRQPSETPAGSLPGD